jgi:hypothetical protein
MRRECHCAKVRYLIAAIRYEEAIYDGHREPIDAADEEMRAAALAYVEVMGPGTIGALEREWGHLTRGPGR